MCVGLARTGPAADRNEIVYGLSNRMGGAARLLLISATSSRLTSFANQRGARGVERACAPHQTSSRDYSNAIVSYPVDGKYRQCVQVDQEPAAAALVQDHIARLCAEK